MNSSNEVNGDNQESIDVYSLLKKLRLYFKGFKHKRGLSATETFKQMKEFIQKVFLALQNCLSKNSE